MGTHGKRRSQTIVSGALTLLVLVAALALAACGSSSTAASTSPSAAPSQAAASPSASPSAIPLPVPTVAGTIAFQRYTFRTGDAPGDIYIVKTDGTGLRQLTNRPGNYGQLWWSPDGKQILYSDFPEGADESEWTMWVMNADGSGKRRLTKAAVRGVAAGWSPDGKQILFMRSMAEEESAVFVMNADGSGVRRAVRPASGSAALIAGDADLFPTWAPDGRILFLRLGQVMAVNPDGSGLVALTKGDNIAAFTVSPDGKRLAVHYNNSDRLASIPLRGGDASVTLLEPVSDYVRIGISEQDNLTVTAAGAPNGKALAVAAAGYYGFVGSRIYVVNDDGSGLSAVPGIENAVDPAWRPE